MTSEQFDAVIVGAGFAGIGAAIQLKRLGYDNFVILDPGQAPAHVFRVTQQLQGEQDFDHGL